MTKSAIELINEEMEKYPYGKLMEKSHDLTMALYDRYGKGKEEETEEEKLESIAIHKELRKVERDCIVASYLNELLFSFVPTHAELVDVSH